MSRLLTYGILNQRFGTALKTNLLGCWEMDEASGTSLADATGGGRNLTTINSPTLDQTGKINKAVAYNGTTQYSRWPSSTGIGSAYFAPPNVISAAGWYYRQGDGNTVFGEVIIGRWRATNGYRSWMINIRQNGSVIRWTYQDSGNAVRTLEYNAGSDIFTGNWMHVVCTRDGDSMKIYLNGTEVSSGNLGTGIAVNLDADSTTYLAVAAQSPGNTFNAYGIIDQCAVWDRELTQSDVDDLYNTGAGRAYSSW